MVNPITIELTEQITSVSGVLKGVNLFDGLIVGELGFTVTRELVDVNTDVDTPTEVVEHDNAVLMTLSVDLGDAVDTRRLSVGTATVGVIASVTRPFCGDCDRVRLTADGQVRNCLFAREESDLRAPLRNGATDEEIADRWVAAMATKRAGHGIDDPTFLQPDRPMSAIGG